MVFRKSKKTVICAILAVALILMGTGYAYWTDSLNVTTKANTGDLDVTFADFGLYAQYDADHYSKNQANWSIIDGYNHGDTDGYISDSFFKDQGEKVASTENNIAKTGTTEAYMEEARKYNGVTFEAGLEGSDTIKRDVKTESGKVVYASATTNGSDKINIQINNMYPGYAQVFRSDILNTGTLAATLGDIDITVNGLEAADKAADMLGIALLIEKEQSKVDGINTYGSIWNERNMFRLCKELNVAAEDTFTLGGVQFLRLSAVSKYMNDTDIAEILSGKSSSTLYLKPSDTRSDIFLGVAMDPDAAGTYTTGTLDKVMGTYNTSKAANDAKDAASEMKGAEVVIELGWAQFNENKEIDSSVTNRLVNQNK